MTRRRLAVLAAGLVLAAQLGTLPAEADPSLDQLLQISEILSANDVERLRSFVEANPDVLVGGSQISGLLRIFMRESEDIATFIAVNPNLSDSLIRLSETEEEETPPGEGGGEVVEEGSDPGNEPAY